MKWQREAALNIDISRERRTRLRSLAVLLAALISALPAGGMNDTFTAQANNLFAQLKLKERGLDHGQVEGFEQRITALKAEAASLDQLQTQVETERNQLDPFEAAFNNARATADASRRKYENDLEDAKRRIEALDQQQYAICSQLGGSVSGKKCEWSCPQNNMAPCQAKLDRFNQQVAGLTSQAASILKGMEAEQQQADVADKNATTARQQWQDKKNELDGLEKDLAGKKNAFEHEADAFEKDLNSAPTTPLGLKNTTALGQLVETDRQLKNSKNGKDVTCYDQGCPGVPVSNLDGIVGAPPASSAAGVQAQPAYQELHNKVTALTQQYNDASAKLRAAESDPHATSAQLTKLVNDFSQISSQLMMKQYELKSYTTDVTVGPPAAK
jgi:DNA repair exonuclease SbcCD ATPase subunit